MISLDRNFRCFIHGYHVTIRFGVWGQFSSPLDNRVLFWLVAHSPILSEFSIPSFLFVSWDSFLHWIKITKSAILICLFVVMWSGHVVWCDCFSFLSEVKLWNPGEGWNLFIFFFEKKKGGIKDTVHQSIKAPRPASYFFPGIFAVPSGVSRHLPLDVCAPLS